MIISCNNISKSFVENTILSNISFHLNENDKAAIIGINGAGKSTLLKILINELRPDEGNVIISKETTIGYLAQNQDIESDKTIFEELLSVKKDIIELEAKIREYEVKLKEITDEDKLNSALDVYSRMTHQFELGNGYAYKSEVIGVIKGLGFNESDFEKKISTLSGGQKTRVALGRILLLKPDIIMLDEPTNHLDISSVNWLETYLRNYKGTVIIVSHDRYFLDNIVNKVICVSNTNAILYTGNYTDYAQKAELVRQAQLKQYMNQQKEIKHQEAVIEKLRSFNREKSIKRAESREKMLQKIERVEKPVQIDDSMNIRFTPATESAKDVLSVEGISKSFSEQCLFEDLSFFIKRGEKTAIIGDNGTGKTTILKIINNLLSADSGKVVIGSNVIIGYYDQEQQLLTPDNTLFEEILDEHPSMTNTEIRNLLAAFLFTGDDVFKYVRDLSGGEKGRLSLAKLMLSKANLLILDEPTNHLDITSKEILEQAIRNYDGTVLYVSHDRYFINRTANRIIELNHKVLTNYLGNYDYYLEKSSEKIEGEESSSNCSNEISEIKQDWIATKEQQAKERKRLNDIKKIEDEIAKLEARNVEIDILLLDEAIYTDHFQLVPLSNEKAANDEKINALLEQWEVLEV